MTYCIGKYNAVDIAYNSALWKFCIKRSKIWFVQKSKTEHGNSFVFKNVDNIA